MTPEQEQQIDEVKQHLYHTLQGFFSQPDARETRNAIYKVLTTILEVSAQRLVEEHIQVETVGDEVVVLLGQPLCTAIRGILGDDVFENVIENCSIKLPGWSKPSLEGQAPTIGVNRTYTDPRTGRPTHGRLGQ